MQMPWITMPYTMLGLPIKRKVVAAIAIAQRIMITGAGVLNGERILWKCVFFENKFAGKWQEYPCRIVGRRHVMSQEEEAVSHGKKMILNGFTVFAARTEPPVCTRPAFRSGSEESTGELIEETPGEYPARQVAVHRAGVFYKPGSIPGSKRYCYAIAWQTSLITPEGRSDWISLFSSFLQSCPFS